MNRRDLLEAFAKAGVVAVFPPMHGHDEKLMTEKVTTVLEQGLPEVTLHNWKLTALEVTYAPGEVDTPHRHPGFVFGYVIAGTLRFQVEGQPEVVFRPGQMFYEAPDSIHRVSANASATQPCRFLAMIFAEDELPLTVPV
jgi:quercetin dioxygenase-like cupin family protein